jgi:hypothetical protein
MACSKPMLNNPKSSAPKLTPAVLSHEGPALHTAQTIATARALRAEHAQAAAYQAFRAEQARVAAQYAEAARWTEGYRRSVARCRLLGETIRGGRIRFPATRPRASAVAPLASRGPAADTPATGEAA